MRADFVAMRDNFIIFIFRCGRQADNFASEFVAQVMKFFFGETFKLDEIVGVLHKKNHVNLAVVKVIGRKKIRQISVGNARTSQPSLRLLKLPLNGVLFAIGAAVCQGVGLVLSKIGMDHYESGIANPLQQDFVTSGWLVPFSANFYRCVAGIIGFLVLLYFRDGMATLREAMHDKKGLSAATATTIFGPFVGVGFSLMAVQYTAAGIASTLMAMTPIIILLPSYWLFHEKITWKTVLGAVISVVGVSLFFLG